MGWTSFSTTYCERNRRGNVDKAATMTHELESWGGIRVVKAAMGGGNYYAVVRDMRLDRHLVVVCLTRVQGGEFYYKEMTDTMGPCYHDCPKSVLDAADELCPCDEKYDPDGYARKWRTRCREKLREKALPTAFAKVRDGGQVTWSVPEDSGLMFDGIPLSGARIVLTKHRGRRTWVWHGPLFDVRVPTKYVSPSDCALA